MNPTNLWYVMNFKRLFSTTITAFIFIFGYEYIVHAILLSDIYEQTSNLWRTKEGSQAFFLFMIMSQLGFAAAATCMFAHYCKAGNPIEGARFGLYLGLVLAAIDLSTYCYMPIPFTLTLSWMAASLFKAIGTGVVVSLVYKK